jgi:hypothetical protein
MGIDGIEVEFFESLHFRVSQLGSVQVTASLLFFIDPVSPSGEDVPICRNDNGSDGNAVITIGFPGQIKASLPGRS